MKIYTKTGDEGKSSLLDGSRVPKNHWRLEAYGTLDELNSYVGKALSELNFTGLASKIPLYTEKQLDQIQNDLFVLGSLLACENESTANKLPSLSESSIMQLESSIDNMNASLTELRNFILPGGHIAASTLHICRTVSRRAERRIVDGQEKNTLPKNTIQYINRLSDYFFVAARFINFHAGIQDQLWQNK